MEDIVNVDVPEIEIAPEMIEAGQGFVCSRAHHNLKPWHMKSVIIDPAIGESVTFGPPIEVRIVNALRRWLERSSYIDMAGILGVVLPNQTKLAPLWESNGRVNRAGDAIRNNTLTNDDARILDLWRVAHNKVLNNFQTIIRNKTRGKDIVVAQRLKRRMTIVDKLFREAGMQLARMDDVAGCRMIFNDIDSLYAFRTEFHKSRFRHEKKNHLDKYDYIKRPKPSGYRGIHDIYGYNARSVKGSVFNGLLIELQYRTDCQHAWATANELVTQVTGSEPKFGRGDPRHMEYFRLASEVIARAHENQTSCYPEMSDSKLVDKFWALEGETKIISLLQGLRVFEVIGADAKSVILQITENNELNIYEFMNLDEATEKYFALERGDLFEHGSAKEDIVLVAGETFAHVRSAYMNYFSDAREFLRFISEGCRMLQGTQ